MQPALVDSHCHLDFPEFEKDISDVLKRADENGVKFMQTICTRISEFPKILAVSEKHKNIWCSVGIHPHNVETEPEVSAAQIIEITKNPKVIGIGETGLDYFYEHSPRELQKKSFRAHIEAARETGIPLIIHTREAEEETAKILEEETIKGKFPALLHCFTSSRNLAEKAIDLGMYISISGIVTFKKAKELHETVKWLPIENMLVETDAPYLAPEPHRGKRNEPGFTRHTAEFIANLKGISYEELALRTTENFFKLFSKAKQNV